MARRPTPMPTGPDVREHIAFLERQVTELEALATKAGGGDEPQIGAAVSARGKAAEFQKRVVQLQSWLARQEPAPPKVSRAPKRSRALLRIAAGRSTSEVARELDVDRRTVNRWRADPEFDEQLRELQDAQMDAVHAMLVGRALDVARYLADVATAPDTQDMARVAAARVFMELLGRHKGSPVAPPEKGAEPETEEDVLKVLDGIPLGLLERAVVARKPKERDL